MISELVIRIKQIILHPNEFWSLQKANEDGPVLIFITHLLPLLLVASVAVFLGEFFSSSHFYIGFAALKAVREFMLFSLFYIGAIFLTNELMKTFGGIKNREMAAKLVAYSMTPLLLLSMLTGLVQYFYLLDILGVYSFYIFWVGGKELLDLPEQKRDSYLLITLLVNFFIFTFLSILLSKLLTAYF